MFSRRRSNTKQPSYGGGGGSPNLQRLLSSSPSLAPSPRLESTEWTAKANFYSRRTVRRIRRGDWSWSWLLYAAAIYAIRLIIIKLFFGPKALPPAPCYAFTKPGRLHLNLTSPLYTHWRPLDEDSCPPLPSYLPALWDLTHGPDRPLPAFSLSAYSKEYQLVASKPIPRHLLTKIEETPPVDPIKFLRKRRRTPPTVLILGDSVDRNGLVYFCQLFKRKVAISLYSNINSHPPDPPSDDPSQSHGPKYEGWDQRGLPHFCEIPFYSTKADERAGGIAMRVVNGFHYGMDALDEFDTPDHNDWHKPGRVEVRIDELVVPMIEQMGGVKKVDLIILHSGMWDLALFGLQDDKTSWSLTVPLTPEQLAWWQERMRRTIYHIRQTFPKSRIVYRKMHRTDDVVAGTHRVHQLRHLQEEVARVEGLPVFDFGHIIEGYQLFQEKVHPLLLPGGVMYAQNVMHQLRLAMEGRKD